SCGTPPAKPYYPKLACYFPAREKCGNGCTSATLSHSIALTQFIATMPPVAEVSLVWPQIIWDEPGGNVEHIEEHGVTVDDVEYVLANPDSKGVSHSSWYLNALTRTRSIL